MKILHLLYESEGDSFGIGGVGIRAYEIYSRLRERHDITLLCKRFPGARDGDIRGLRHVFAGVETESLTKTLLSYAYYAARYVGTHGDEFDMIVEEFSPAIPTFLHRVTGKPIVLQVQGFTGGLYFRKYNLLYAAVLYAMERLRPRQYSNFIFMNEETARRFSLGARGRCAIIPNGISPELLNLVPEEDTYILYLGRLDLYGKGLDTLLAGYTTFHASFPDIRLVVAGDGRDRERFLREHAGVPSRVRRDIEMPGWVSGERKTELIRRALFTVFPSRHEVQPITALEAMACGKAMVVSDISEFGFVTIGGAGISFKTGDASSLAEAMKNLAMSRELRAMGKNGRDSVRHLTWEHAASTYEAFLSDVMTPSRRGSHEHC